MSIERLAPDHRRAACPCACGPEGKGKGAGFDQALKDVLPGSTAPAPAVGAAPGKHEQHGSWKLEGSPRHHGHGHHHYQHHSEANPAAV